MLKLSTRTIAVIALFIAPIALAADPASRPATTAATQPSTPADLGQTFVKLMHEGKADEAEKLLMTREQFLATFDGEDAQDTYAQLHKRYIAAIKSLAPQMRSAEYVKMNMRFAGEPTLMRKGAGPPSMRLKKDTRILDNTHVDILIDGVQRDLKLDEMFMIDGQWRLFNAPSLRPGR